MWFVLLVVCGLVGVWVYYGYNSKMRHMVKLAKQIPGPTCYPIVQNALEFGISTTDMPINMERLLGMYGFVMKLWIANGLFIIIYKPEDLEIVLGSNRTIAKGRDYDFLIPWIGTGLLTSTGAKWRKHRKMLTPTFHFNILEQFIDVFNTNGDILVEMLKEHEDGPTFDVYPYVSLYTLDNICETAMGVPVNAQRNTSSVYVNAVKNASEIILLRTVRPWLRPEFLFRYFPEGRLFQKSVKLMHKHTNDVIKMRRAEIAARKAAQNATDKDLEDSHQDAGVKKRLAFLDLLIEASGVDGNVLTDEDIREEVDTFMFEGHDTTASCISFALFLLSKNQHIQDKVCEELDSVFADNNEPSTSRQLQELRYTERVIKETLRLFPSVPVFTRAATEDIPLSGGQVIPRGATVAVMPVALHRCELIYPDPLTFDPDRFLPENCLGRHPYAFIPFSAGPRNCIGQKFAMLEVKSGLSHVLRKYRVLPAPDDEGIMLTAGLIMKSKTGTRVKIVSRN